MHPEAIAPDVGFGAPRSGWARDIVVRGAAEQTHEAAGRPKWGCTEWGCHLGMRARQRARAQHWRLSSQVSSARPSIRAVWL
jgi:hypothetical protein